jgi:predicted ArsR family transcriptional regulator
MGLPTCLEDTPLKAEFDRVSARSQERSHRMTALAAAFEFAADKLEETKDTELITAFMRRYKQEWLSSTGETVYCILQDVAAEMGLL